MDTEDSISYTESYFPILVEKVDKSNVPNVFVYFV